MDDAYQKAADYFGFNCTGCEDNCCFTRFYHHTLLEYFFILEGYNRLGHEKQAEVKRRALKICQKTDLADEKEEPIRLMCPLNVDGFCLTYDFRPLICRLHGIPHEFHKSGRAVMYGRGCDAFYKHCPKKEPFKFDRTPFYLKMAQLEKELRQAVDMTQKIKMTIAQMITTFAPHP